MSTRTLERAECCATCGKKRKPLEHRRDSWGVRQQTAGVPRPNEPEHRPWQQFNDLIISACVYRNGGTSEDCHLCDDCLRIGLRALKAEIDAALEEVTADASAELAELNRRLFYLQFTQHRIRQAVIDRNCDFDFSPQACDALTERVNQLVRRAK